MKKELHMNENTIDLNEPVSVDDALGNIKIKSEEDQTIVLEPGDEPSVYTIPSQSDGMKFDDRFKNRKSRRTFMKLINSARVEKSFKTVVNPRTGKRKRVNVVKVNPKEHKLSWDLMPKFTKCC